MFPFRDLAKVQALGSVLKVGRYKSAESYLSLYRAESERRGFVWSAAEQRAHRDAVRSCQRGLGGPQRALIFPLPVCKNFLVVKIRGLEAGR